MFNQDQLKTTVSVINAISHKLRIKIINTLKRSPGLSVTEIYKTLGIEQSRCSQQLKILKDAGFLTTTRSGTTIHYQLNNEFLTTVINEIYIFSE